MNYATVAPSAGGVMTGPVSVDPLSSSQQQPVAISYRYR